MVPNIFFESLQFIYNGNRPDYSDSLILTIRFQDGDADLGLNSNVTAFPYENYNPIIDSKGFKVTKGGKNYSLPFRVIRGNGSLEAYSSIDNRPPYNCNDYEILTMDTKKDTFLIKKNSDSKNIFVDFYKKKKGLYERIVFNAGCEYSFNARFPVLQNKFVNESVFGTITYVMADNIFRYVINKDTFRIKVYIKDRALHSSNVVVSPDLLLFNSKK